MSYEDSKTAIASMTASAQEYYNDARLALNTVDYDMGTSAGRALSTAAASISQALSMAEQAASNNRVAPEGRADEVAAIAQKMGAEVEDAVGAAETAAIIADANYQVQAMPQFDGAKQDGIANLSTILSAAPAERRTNLLYSLAERDGSVSAALFSPEGKTLVVDALGMDSEIYDGLREMAMQAAGKSNDPKRRKAAEMRGKVAGVSKAAVAYRSAAYTAQEALSGLASQAGHDARDTELKRLRSMVASDRGHAE